MGISGPKGPVSDQRYRNTTKSNFFQTKHKVTFGFTFRVTLGETPTVVKGVVNHEVHIVN